MGRDPKAMLFYGIPFTDEQLESVAPEDESLSYWTEKSYSYDNAEKDKFVPHPKDDGDYTTPEWDKWREDSQNWEQEQCTLGTCGDSDGDSYSMGIFVYVRKLMTSVEWNETSAVTTVFKDENEKKQYDDKIKQYCDALGLPYVEPNWHLAAYYG